MVPAVHVRNASVAREGLFRPPGHTHGMTDYAIFGGVLRTSMEFPSLRPRPATRPTWTLHVRAPAAMPSGARALGVDQVDASAKVQLYRSRDEWHLLYDDTGRFDIDAAGQTIVWRALPDASEDAARLDVMSRVLATAMHAAGDVCFHASAVAVGGKAIAFLGAKGFGKSTLAWALVRAGARLLTDDTLRIRLDETPLAYPGVHELRLRHDAATRLPPDSFEAQIAGDRLVVDALDLGRLQGAPAPIGGLYLLAPMADLPGAAAIRVSALTPVSSALGLVRHAKIAPLLGSTAAVELLDRVVALARRVPVRLLEVARDFSRLDEVVADVLAGHGDCIAASAR
jgi:hypothetical protein